MIRKPSNYLPALLTVFAISMTGCATTSNRDGSAASDPIDINYEVKPGDRLGDIALRLTGEIRNWETIAARNEISNPRTLAVGKVIVIPGELLQPVYPIDVEEDVPQATPSVIADNKALAPPVTTGNGVSIVRGRGAPVGEPAQDTANISMSAVTVNRSFELQPINEPPQEESGEPHYDSQAPQVRVSGTYFPKGIYDQPANYARLISRAAPGTLFRLDSEINDWYKIVTDQGIGYIRQRDSALVDQ